MKCALYLKEIVKFKKTFIYSNKKNIKNSDVFGRFLYLYHNDMLSLNAAIKEIFKELNENKYIKGINFANMSRSIKKLFVDWKKCLKRGDADTEKMPLCIKNFKEKLNRSFKCIVHKKSNNGIKINCEEMDDDEYSDIYDTNDNEICDGDDEYIAPKLNPEKKIKIDMTTKVFAALDRSKISTRSAVHVIGAAAEALGYSPNDIVLNRETIRVARKNNRDKIYDDVLAAFSPDCPLTVHWDGKKMDDLKEPKKVERLAVYVTGW